MTANSYAALVARGLANEIRLAREALGLSKYRLAADAEIERSYVTHIEKGAKVPSVAVLLRIAFVLRVPAAELLRRAEQFAATFGDVGQIR